MFVGCFHGSTKELSSKTMVLQHLRVGDKWLQLNTIVNKWRVRAVEIMSNNEPAAEITSFVYKSLQTFTNVYKSLEIIVSRSWL